MSKYLVSGPNASRVVIFVQPTLICVLTYAAAAPVGSERVAVLASRRHCGRAQEFHVHTHMRALACGSVPVVVVVLSRVNSRIMDTQK